MNRKISLYITTFWLTKDHNLFSQVQMFPQLFTVLDLFQVTILNMFLETANM